MDIYTTGGGYFIVDILNFVAGFHGGSNFDHLMLIGISAGVLSLSYSLMMGASFQRVGGTVAVMTFASTVLIGNTTTVNIHDKTLGGLTYFATVDNVPYGVAALASATTTASYELTNFMETGLSTPTDISYQKNGIVFGASLIAQQARWRAVDSGTHEQLVEFFEKCIIRGINLGYWPVDTFARAPDLFASIDANAPPGLSFYDYSDSAVVDCPTGWETLKGEITTAVDDVLKYQAASLYQGRPLANAEDMVNRLGDSISSFQTLVGMSSATASTTIRQAMLINGLDDGIQRMAALSGNDAALSNLAYAISEAQRRGSYAMVGAAALKWVPYLKIVFEIIYYGIFPLALMLMMTPLALTVFKSYCGGFIWLAAWEPLSAILHAVVLWASSGFYREAAIQTTDGLPTDVAVTWANHFGVIAVEQDVAATAGYLMMSVPFLSYAIFFGVRSITSLATSTLAVGQGAAIEAGRTSATGNVSLGTGAMNEFRANKWDTSSLRDEGRALAYLESGGLLITNADESSAYFRGSAQSDTGFSAALNSGIRREVSTRAEEARSAANTTASELAEHYSDMSSNYLDFGRTVSALHSEGEANSIGLTRNQADEVRNAMRTVDEWGKSNNVASDVALTAALSSNGGAMGQALKQIAGFAVNASGNLSATDRETVSIAEQASRSGEIQQALATLQSYSETSNWGYTETSGDRANDGTRRSIDEGSRMAATLSRQLREAASYSEAAAQMSSDGVQTNRQMTQVIVGELESRGMSPAQIDQILNAKDFDAIASQGNLLDGIVSDMVDFFGVGQRPADATRPYSARDLYNPPVSPPDPGSADDAISLYPTQPPTEQTRTHDAWQEGERRGVQDRMGHRERMVDALVAEDAYFTFGNRGEKEIKETVDDVGNAIGGAVSSVAESLGLSDSPNTIPGMGKAAPSIGLSPADRDTVIRTVLGEAGSEPASGMGAVAWTIRNRMEDGRWPDDAGDVSTQPWQFSSWNRDASGTAPNDRFDPSSDAYQRVGRIVDNVFAGDVADPTDGATHFFAPQLMAQHYQEGSVSSPTPAWYEEETSTRGAPPVSIGGHVFTGRKEE